MKNRVITQRLFEYLHVTPKWPKRKSSTLLRKGNVTNHQNNEYRGLIMLQNISRSFYEVLLRQFFKKFGYVTRIRLATSKKRSEDYAYVEFQHPAVARVVNKTMNDLKMKCEYIPPQKRKYNYFDKESNDDCSLFSDSSTSESDGEYMSFAKESDYSDDDDYSQNVIIKPRKEFKIYKHGIQKPKPKKTVKFNNTKSKQIANLLKDKCYECLFQYVPVNQLRLNGKQLKPSKKNENFSKSDAPFTYL